MKKQILTLGLVTIAALMIAACVPTQTTTQTQTGQVAQPAELSNAPDFTASLPDGTTVSRTSLSDKPTVVYFMASWCSSCAKNWDALNAIYPEYADRVNFVAISVDPTDDANVISALAAEKGFAFDAAIGNVQAAQAFGVKKQTAKFAIDTQGNIVARHDGVLTPTEWRDMFESLLPAQQQNLETAPVEQEAEVAQPAEANAAPDFTATLPDGTTMTKTSLSDKPTVVYFMASWCSSCAKNWNALNAVYPDYEDRVNFVAISVDPTDDADVISALAADKGFVFDAAIGNVDAAKAFDVKKQTAKFALDADGNIVSRHDGVLSEQEWRDMFESLL